MDVHLVDGTYELFRHFFAVPSRKNSDGLEVGAVRGAVGSMLMMLEGGATHVGVATDHVIESFRNQLWPGYKTGAGIDQFLWQQFPLLEEALAALGLSVWPMVEVEADDALGAVASQAAGESAVGQVLICSPDKDLAQCVSDRRVVQLDRRSGKLTDEAGVVEKFGVIPGSIPDYLALVGDSADGFPGLPGWGARSAATVLAHYGHLEAIPLAAADWQVSLRGADKLARTLVEETEHAFLFRDLATLRLEAPKLATVEDLRWSGPTDDFFDICGRIAAEPYLQRATKLAQARSP